MFIETTPCWQTIFGWLRFQPVQACLMYIINPTGYGNKMVCNKIMIVCFENYRLRKKVANKKMLTQQWMEPDDDDKLVQQMLYYTFNTNTRATLIY